jgi:UDP-N-acetylmuramate: L-alanyl-gamma-D-glutamyl-meso-diaminopimelate ligase
VTGEHNVLNSLAVWAAARGDGLSPATIADAFATFRGAKRRLEELGTAAGVTVVDDFAHHPTAVAASLKALRSRYPGRRLVALFEPRSLTAGRSLFQQAYVEAFSEADRIFLAPLFHEGRLPAEERLDRKSLVAALGERGIPSHAAASVEALITDALTEARPGDVLVTMSSGSFEGACRRLLEALSERQALLAG